MSQAYFASQGLGTGCSLYLKSAFLYFYSSASLHQIILFCFFYSICQYLDLFSVDYLFPCARVYALQELACVCLAQCQVSVSSIEPP